MTAEMRMNEILSNMHYCAKNLYRRDEMLSEMNGLEKEMIMLTFNQEHADQGGLWIRDVEDHLIRLNEENGGIANKELEQFVTDCKDFANFRRGIISGYKGEEMTFSTLNKLRIENKVLRNVELSDGNSRTELDAVILTSKCVWIVEIKNTKRNIFISEDGQYYRIGEYLRLDSDIGYKMRLKSELLAKLLHNEGYDVPIKSILLFSNDRIQVQNRYKQITTCFLSQLDCLIEENVGEDVLRTEEMDALAAKIDNIVRSDTFPIKIDIEKMKRDYATLMVKLEMANGQAATEDNESVDDVDAQTEEPEMMEETSKKRSVFQWISKMAQNPYIRGGAGTIAAAGLILLVKTAIKRL